MTTSEIITFAVVLLVGMPSAFRVWIRGGLRVSILNATALGLIASFLIVQATWWTVHAAPLELFILCDFIVITVIFLKGPPIERVPATGLLNLARACWVELSRSDKIIAASFVPCWASYAVIMGDTPRYWILWTIGLSQFILAGAEAFGTWRRGRASASSKAHPADWFLRQRRAAHGC